MVANEVRQEVFEPFPGRCLCMYECHLALLAPDIGCPPGNTSSHRDNHQSKTWCQLERAYYLHNEEVSCFDQCRTPKTVDLLRFPADITSRCLVGWGLQWVWFGESA